MRRSHHGKKAQQFNSCPKCSTAIPGHTACPNCGTYKGREVINVLKKLDKKEKRAKEKELAAQEEDGHNHDH